MSQRIFEITLILIAAGFTATFAIVVIPALIEDRDIIAAFAAGFVNPYSSGYSADVIFCWAALGIWILFEAKAHSIKHGWVCLLLGLVPGVAVGFPLYLVLRSRQLSSSDSNECL